MSRKFSVVLVLCIALFGAILAGYWDMLSSEREKQEGETVAEGASAPSATPLSATETKPEASAPAATAENTPPAVAPSAPATTPAQPAQPTTPPATQTASNSQSPTSPGTSSPTMSDAPRFDLLRVEPDGSAVIAGQAAAGSEIRILSGDRQVGRAKASREGDFALVLEERLTVGSHSIRIEAQRPDGRTQASQEVAVVSVPRPGRPGDLLAMIETPGQPSRLIAVPKAEEPAASASTDGQPAGAQAVQPQVSGTEQQAPVSPAPQAAPAAPEPFAVEAVEIENGTIYVAGRAEGKNPVRVYVDEKLVGEDRDRANGRFLVTAEAPLAPGEHRIRADILGPDGKVASRVEVPFTKPEGETMSALASNEPRGDAAPATAAATPDAAKPDPAAPDEAPAGEAAGAQASASGNAEVGTVMQPALQAVDTRVLIRRGDTLWRISRDTYGLGRRYTVIYLANGDQIRNPNRIYPGQLLRLPKHEGETQTR